MTVTRLAASKALSSLTLALAGGQKMVRQRLTLLMFCNCAMIEYPLHFTIASSTAEPDKSKDQRPLMAKDITTASVRANCQEKGAHLLDPADFCRLLLSRKHLIRGNKTGASAVVLIDPVSGKRYQVDGEGLDRFIERAAG